MLFRTQDDSLFVSETVHLWIFPSSHLHPSLIAAAATEVTESPQIWANFSAAALPRYIPCFWTRCDGSWVPSAPYPRESPFRFRTWFLKHMDVSENSGFSPQIIHFNRVFHYKPSILRYPYSWKNPHGDGACHDFSRKQTEATRLYEIKIQQ